MKTLCGLSLLIFLANLSCDTSRTPAYLDTRLDFESRAEDLVKRMTLEEKVGQLTHSARRIERLGIPEYNWWNECLHGVARAGEATVFPQAIGMAATFNRDLVYRMAEVTSTEARAKYNDFISREMHGIYQGLTFWSPNINIFRDPRWGRGQETYGEDPYLTGELGVQFINGIQGNDPVYLKAVATAKHYVVHNGPEPLRHEFDAQTDEIDFRETYLPAFRKCVRDAHVYSVMCAYNRYQGEPCCGSEWLQQEILRGEFGFDGYVVSDCGAIRDLYEGHRVVSTKEEAAARGILSGTDLNCGDSYEALLEAVKSGLLTEQDLDVSVKRLMLARMRLGMFDPPGRVPWSGLALEEVASDAHRELALKMARESMVLLKNDPGSLPLSKEVRRVAVIGPNADNEEVLYGNYNGFARKPVTVLEGIRAKLGSTAEVRYALGAPHHSNFPYLVPVPGSLLFRDPEGTLPGIEAEFFPRPDAEGTPLHTRTDALVDFHWWDGEPPFGDLEEDAYSVRWTGYLKPRRTGPHTIALRGKYVSLIIDGDTIGTLENDHRPRILSRQVSLVKDRACHVEILMQDRHNDAFCTLLWEEPGLPLLSEAMEAARWADQVILVMGLNSRLEGEEMRDLVLEGFDRGDRTSLDLPAVQEHLIRSVASLGKPVTLVVMSGSALSLNWEDEHLPAILQAWYGGEAAGAAIADVLYGDYNPAGRLPVTFYKSVDDLPPFEDYSLRGRTYRYFEGKVLYPFGYGLSYTTFEYDNLILERNEISAGEKVTVSVDITNSGKRDGEEVVQLYIRNMDPGERGPLRELKGFSRVFVKSGQTLAVTLVLGPEEFEHYDTGPGKYVVAKGEYQIMVGPDSDESRLLTSSLTIR